MATWSFEKEISIDQPTQQKPQVLFFKTTRYDQEGDSKIIRAVTPTSGAASMGLGGMAASICFKESPGMGRTTTGSVANPVGPEEHRAKEDYLQTLLFNIVCPVNF